MSLCITIMTNPMMVVMRPIMSASCKTPSVCAKTGAKRFDQEAPRVDDAGVHEHRDRRGPLHGVAQPGGGRVELGRLGEGGAQDEQTDGVGDA